MGGRARARRASRARSAPTSIPWMMYRFLRDAIWVSVRWYRPDGRGPSRQTRRRVRRRAARRLGTDGRGHGRERDRHEAEVLQVDEIAWPDEQPDATRRRSWSRRRSGSARAASSSRGARAASSRRSRSSRPATTVPMHSHDHDEMIIVLDGGCTMLGDGGPTLQARRLDGADRRLRVRLHRRPRRHDLHDHPHRRRRRRHQARAKSRSRRGVSRRPSSCTKTGRLSASRNDGRDRRDHRRPRGRAR